MKKTEVKELLFDIRKDIIEEIAEQARRDGNTQEMFVKDWRSFEYGYLRGLTEAAMIMLERIYSRFPEERKKDRYWNE